MKKIFFTAGLSLGMASSLYGSTKMFAGLADATNLEIDGFQVVGPVKEGSGHYKYIDEFANDNMYFLYCDKKKNGDYEVVYDYKEGLARPERCIITFSSKKGANDFVGSVIDLGIFVGKSTQEWVKLYADLCTKPAIMKWKNVKKTANDDAEISFEYQGSTYRLYFGTKELFPQLKRFLEAHKKINFRFRRLLKKI